MLKNNNKESLDRPNSDAIANPIQDPWSIPNKAQEQKNIPEAWQLPKEPYSLISPAGNPEAPRLVSHQSTSEEILLEDELKLKNNVGSLLKQQLEKALALLYWVIQK